MNENIEEFLQENFKGFLKLVELGVIDKEIGMKAVIKSKDPLYIYNFVKNIKGSNIEKLEDAIIKTRDVYYMYFFAKNIKGANIKKIQDEIDKINKEIKKAKEKKSELKILKQLLQEKKV